MEMKKIAEKVFTVCQRRNISDETLIWDECDLMTGGELDFFQMNMLITMVVRRLRKARASKKV